MEGQKSSALIPSMVSTERLANLLDLMSLTPYLNPLFDKIILLKEKPYRMVGFSICDLEGGHSPRTKWFV